MRNLQSYPAKIEKEDDGYTVFFRDLPNTFTYGETYEEALMYAEEVLEAMLESMLDNEFEFNLPSNKKEDEVDIPIPAYIVFSMLIRAYRIENEMTQTELAKNLGVSQQQITKMEKPNKNRKLETVSNLLEKFGYEIEIKKKAV